MQTQLRQLIDIALQSLVGEAALPAYTLERTKQAQHGDFACNVAMQLARSLKKNPRDIALQLQAALPSAGWLIKTEIAGAGFINFFLTAATRWQVVFDVLQQGAAFGHCNLGKQQSIQIEFVSANPTGPLHVGHGRGAAYGSSLANILGAVGYKVTREYYVNDAGRQMDILALSTWLRYLALHGEVLPFPPNVYQGDYVCDMASALSSQYAARFVQPSATILSAVVPQAATEDATPEGKAQREAHLDGLIAQAKHLLGEDYYLVHAHALHTQLAECKADLTAFGVVFETWFSEKSLFDRGLVAHAMDILQKNGHLYTQNDAIWFRSTAFGDEKDRVVQRDNGLYTYFASDIAYHLNKFERGFAQVINVWGADHHGYIARVKGALQAIEQDPSRLSIALIQFATLWRAGVQAKMSTRSGEFVTLAELRDEIGNDAARFFYVLRKHDQPLDFDLDLAKAQNNENPVYYIQMAHARICRVEREFVQQGQLLANLNNADLSLLNSPSELQLFRRLNEYHDALQTAARDYAPHLMAFYLKDLAADLHSYYNAERFLLPEQPALSQARIALISAVRQVLANGLSLLGVSAPESM